MDYEKKYNEALKRAKAAIDVAADRDLVKGVAGTIFPELRESESEDERIRDKIIWLLQQDICPFPDEEAKQMVAWLEEQKEQKPASTEDMPYVTDEHFFEREQADSFKYRLAEYMTKNCKKEESPYGYTYKINSETILEMAKEELIKRGELQKPVEWSEEDEEMLEYIIGDVNDAKQLYKTQEAKDIADKEISWLKSLRQIVNANSEKVNGNWSEEDEKLIDDVINSLCCYQNTLSDYQKEIVGEEIRKLKSLKPQPKPEWSEEDEIQYEEVLYCIQVYQENCKDKDELQKSISGYSWLKSLPERLNLQLKQGWSDKDEVMFYSISLALECWYNYLKLSEPQSDAALRTDIVKNSQLNWLKSLRPQWKPTEEQMEALEYVIRDYIEDGCNATANYLQEILDQIKKL